MRHTALVLLLLTPALVQAQQRKVYLRACEDKDLRRLDALESERDVGRAAVLYDELFGVAARPDRRDRLVEVAPFERRGLRAELLVRLERSPAIAARVRALQAQGAVHAQRAGEAAPVELLRRFPLAPAAADAALTLWSQAVEAGDPSACFDLVRRLRRWQPERLKEPEGRARLALLLACAGDAQGAQRELAALEEQDEALAARTEPAVAAALRRAAPTPAPTAGKRLKVVASHAIAAEEDASRTYSPAYASEVEGRVVVSNGVRVSVFDAQGMPLGQIPASAGSATDVPPAETGFQARPSGRPGLVYTPLVVERWLAPGRKQVEGDAALAGRYYALLALDPAQVRVLWWDGDAASTGGPPGWGSADSELRDVLARGHTIAVACDARRVYVALTLKGDEPELWLFAYEPLISDGALSLRPAWSSATYLLSAERAQGSAEDEPMAAEVAASLALDGRGRLLCTTNLGLTACLATLDGELQWVHEARPDPRRKGGFRLRGPQDVDEPPPEPARFVRVDGERGAVFFAGSQLISARLSDGALRWQRERGRGHRILVHRELLVLYGGLEVMMFGPDGTLLQPSRGLLRFPCVGEAARIGDTLFFPTLKGGGRPIVFLERCELQGRGLMAPVAGGSFPLPAVTEPVNLAAIGGGVIAASRARVVFLSWE